MEKGRITDISMTLQEPMRGFRKSEARKLATDGWNASTLEIYSHAGTHMDAPMHFEAGEETIDTIPVDRMICMCHVVRIQHCTPRMLITQEHLGSAAEAVQPGEGLIFHTGWSKYANEPSVYRDQLPRISLELARWLSARKVNMVGVEPPSVADVNNLEELQSVHHILMEGNVLILEGLCNLEQVQNNYVQLVALPLKIGGGDGAPVRAIIIES